MRMVLQSHGIEFVRSGKCQQCGACGCNNCPHHYEQDGKHWCGIYDTRDQYCEQCETDHGGCVEFPDNPWIHVVRDGKCAYSFERLDGGSMDELPFLNGERYRRWP